jgi:hypothetical protein
MNETADILVHGLVMNRVDDCHSLYYDLRTESLEYGFQMNCRSTVSSTTADRAFVRQQANNVCCSSTYCILCNKLPLNSRKENNHVDSLKKNILKLF